MMKKIYGEKSSAFSKKDNKYQYGDTGKISEVTYIFSYTVNDNSYNITKNRFLYNFISSEIIIKIINK